MRADDQPRPDLDAAIDAVVPSLTAIGDDAAADSLRRTRIALAGSTPRTAGANVWGRGVAAAMVLAIGLAAVSVWQRSTARVPEVAATPRPTPPVAASAPAAVTPTPVAPAPGPRVARSVPAPRVARPPSERVRATSGPAPEPMRRADPLSTLVAAVQAIPEDAWARGTAAPEVTAAPIAIAPLETPPITDAPPEPAAPGEP